MNVKGTILLKGASASAIINLYHLTKDGIGIKRPELLPDIKREEKNYSSTMSLNLTVEDNFSTNIMIYFFKLSSILDKSKKKLEDASILFDYTEESIEEGIIASEKILIKFDDGITTYENLGRKEIQKEEKMIK